MQSTPETSPRLPATELSLDELVHFFNQDEDSSLDPTSELAYVSSRIDSIARAVPFYDTPHGMAARSIILRLANERTMSNPAQNPLRQFIVKTVADCNLRCLYCYEYTDDSWERFPPTMKMGTIALTARRIAEYSLANKLSSVDIIMHGGEPFFMKQPEVYYDQAFTILRAIAKAINPDLRVNFSVQTNATRINTSILDVLKKHDVSVGVSMDGDKSTHNARRVTKFGMKGSFDKTREGIRKIQSPQYGGLFAGVLAVVDPESDPLAFYEALKETGARSIDFLWPYRNNDDRSEAEYTSSQTPLADWHEPIFYNWLQDPNRPNIRIFTSLIRLVLGGTSETEALGRIAGSEVVIRTDGSYELVDALKMSGGGIQETNMDVREHDLEAIANLMRASGHLGLKTVPDACVDCRFLNECGAGHIQSRYSKERGYNNRSAYCADLMKLIGIVSIAVHESIFRHNIHDLPSVDGCLTCDPIGF